MSKGFFKVPVAINEPVRAYEPGSKHRDEVIRPYEEKWQKNATGELIQPTSVVISVSATKP